MINNKKKTFFERLAGNLGFDDSDDFEESESIKIENKPSSSHGVHHKEEIKHKIEGSAPIETSVELSVDVYQTPSEIVVQAIIAGVSPDNLSINITRDSITIKGKREENRSVQQDGFLLRELYWGAFSRTIQLPAEVEIDTAEAICKNGMLMIKLRKMDKYRQTTVRVKTI